MEEAEAPQGVGPEWAPSRCNDCPVSLRHALRCLCNALDLL